MQNIISVFSKQLNNILSIVKKSTFVSIDHINFQMNDLVEAVKSKKEELEKEIIGANELDSSELVDEKIENIRERFIGIDAHKKVLKKTN